MKPQVNWNRWNLFILLAASFHFAIAYTVNTSPFLNLPAFASGHERDPFQYRPLTAWLYWLANHLLHLSPSFARYLPRRLRSVDSLVIFPLAFVSLVGGVVATRFTLESLSVDPRTSRWWALLVIFMSYFHYLLDFGHPCCVPFQLPYDLPSMALFALCLYLLVTGKTYLFFLFFTVATLNRESSLFLIPILVLYRSVGIQNVRSPGVPRLAIDTAVLAAIWIAIRVLVHAMYSPLPMDGPHIGRFGFHVFDNLTYLIRPYYWASYLSIFGFTWLFIYAHGLQIPHKGIQRALLVTPVCVACLYVVGVFSEIRIFGELISLHVVALTLLLQSLLARPQAASISEPSPFGSR